MNVEENRLRTFSHWPRDTHVQCCRIAQAGFFCTKAKITLECFACHLQIIEWSPAEQVMAKHRQLRPDCPFVKDPAASGNISVNAGVMDQRGDCMQDEATRLRTFVNWPAAAVVAPEALARAGFYSLRENDFTKCAFCNGVVGAWERGDDPDCEHRRHFPNCSFVLSIIEPRLGQGADVSTRARSSTNIANLHLVRDANLAALGVNAHKGPRKPKYGTVEARLTTFANWPEELLQTPAALAQSGFYYEGSNDHVRCFHCDGGLKHWDPQDEPWTEHARWFPHCGFVALLKGQDFIAACAPDLDATSMKELQANRKTAQHRKEITEREVQMQMLTPIARGALDVGLQVDRVKQAIREKMECTGAPFSTSDALIEATLNLQRDEEDTDEDAQISRSVTNMLNEVICSINDSAAPTEHKSAEAAHSQETSSAPTTTSNAPQSNNLSLEEENRLLKEARLCKICMDNEVGIVFLPCGHLATCINCAPNLQDCPVCRCAIKATVRTFLS